MNTLRPFLLLAAITLFLAGCIKRNYFTNLWVDKQLADNYSFQPGTYWVYRDSATSIEDSFVVYRNFRDTEFIKNNSEYIGHVFILAHHYRDTVLYDTAELALDLTFTEVRLGIHNSVYIVGEVVNAPIIDTVVMGTAYHGIRRCTQNYSNAAIMLCQDKIGVVVYPAYNKTSATKTPMQLVRYHIVQ